MTDRRRGVLYAVAGGVFWGGSGVAGQYLLQDAGFATEWLVTARLVLAGVILLALDAAQHGGDIFRVWHSRRNCAELLFFGVCGMMLVSYSYFASIRYGNAAAGIVRTLEHLRDSAVIDDFSTVDTKQLGSPDVVASLGSTAFDVAASVL